MKRNQNTGQMLSKTTFKRCHKLPFFQMIGAHLLNKVQLEWILHGQGIRKYLTSQLQPINFDHDDCIWNLSHSSVWGSMNIFFRCVSLPRFFLLLGFASCNKAEHGGGE